MNNKKTLALFLAVTLVSFTGSARAALIQDNLVDNLYLSASGQPLLGSSQPTATSTFGQFDLTGQDYDYARVTFSFVDDTYLFDGHNRDDLGEVDNTSGEYPYIRSDYGSSSSQHFDGYEIVEHRLQDIIETAAISIGGITSGSASASFMDMHYVNQHHHDEDGHYWGNLSAECMPQCQDDYDLYHAIKTSGYTGYFSFESVLPKSLIDSSLLNGMLGFNIRAESGDFHLASATIETFVASVSVPEPSTTALLVLGLLGLGARRRSISA